MADAKKYDGFEIFAGIGVHAAFSLAGRHVENVNIRQLRDDIEAADNGKAFDPDIEIKKEAVAAADAQYG